jgi:hypothetical protein
MAAEADGCLQSFELYEAESVSSLPPRIAMRRRVVRGCLLLCLVAGWVGWWDYVARSAVPPVLALPKLLPVVARPAPKLLTGRPDCSWLDVEERADM